MRTLRAVGSLLVLLAVTSPVRAQTPSNNLDDYALFAILELRSRGLVVTDGDVGVNAVGGQIYVPFGIHAPGSDIAASRVRISESECRTLFTNDAPSKRCGTSRRFVSPFANSTAVATACHFPTKFPTCGLGTITVKNAQALRLPPGDYGPLVIRGGTNPGRLILLGGDYRFCSLKTGRNTDVLFDSSSQVFIDGDLDIGGTGFSGSGGGDIGAPDVRVFVRGSSVKIRPHARVFGRLCAPNAKMKIRWGAKLFGSFIAQTIRTDHITIRGLPTTFPGTTTTTTTTTTSRPTTTATTTTTTTTKPAGKCGNGLIDPGESCDPPGGLVCGSPGGTFVGCGEDCTCPHPVDLRCCLPPSPAGGFIGCELLKPAECAAEGGVLLGMGSCDPSPCSGITIPPTTMRPSTTTSTTRPSTSTTSTTRPAATTTTTATTVATTTTIGSGPLRPVVQEVCGNCVDDDGNGATDFEDAACCTGTQKVEMVLRNGRIRPRGATSALKLQSTLYPDPAGIDPRRQDVFVQIRGDNGQQLFCAHVPATRFVPKHGAFRFWDKQHAVTSAKGLEDMTVKLRRSGRVTFQTHGKRAQLSGATQGTFRITVGFRDAAQVGTANRCALVQQRFRAGSAGALLAR